MGNICSCCRREDVEADTTPTERSPLLHDCKPTPVLDPGRNKLSSSGPDVVPVNPPPASPETLANLAQLAPVPESKPVDPPLLISEPPPIQDPAYPDKDQEQEQDITFDQNNPDKDHKPQQEFNQTEDIIVPASAAKTTAEPPRQLKPESKKKRKGSKSKKSSGSTHATTADESGGDGAPWWWERELMRETLAPSGVGCAAIVSMDDGAVRAGFPDGIVPTPDTVRDVTSALRDGDVSGLAERGIQLGAGLPVCVPGKIDAGRAVYGMAAGGSGGGCTVVRTNSCLLFVGYDNDAEHAERVARKAADFMQENDR